jgi:hypothetical protein
MVLVITPAKAAMFVLVHLILAAFCVNSIMDPVDQILVGMMVFIPFSPYNFHRKSNVVSFSL